jgi:hypothetical protein
MPAINRSERKGEFTRDRASGQVFTQEGQRGTSRSPGHRNPRRRPATADECFEAMVRHNAGQRPATQTLSAGGHGGGGDGGGSRLEGDDSGDIIYGAKAIARFLFGDGGNRARRRVFNLWAHYSARKEKTGFFKLKGALCLSKTLWRRFHGLG